LCQDYEHLNSATPVTLITRSGSVLTNWGIAALKSKHKVNLYRHNKSLKEIVMLLIDPQKSVKSALLLAVGNMAFSKLQITEA
jgi:hypothetical protein